MNRAVAIAGLSIVTLSGCATGGKTDPILGAQVVPAPRTGAVNSLAGRQPPPEEYYSGGSQPTIPAEDDPYSPPGGSFQYSGASGFRPPNRGDGPREAVDAQASRESSDRSSGSRASGIPVRSTNPGDKPPGREEPPAGADRYRSTSGSAEASGVRGATYLERRIEPPSSRSLPATSGRVRDIIEPESRNERSERSGFRPNSSVRAASFTARDRSTGETVSRQPVEDYYDYDPDYRWLKGKLEYSRSERRWKLRYIPISGETDRYGGSVVLEDAPELDEMRPGDIVTVHGRLGDNPADGYAPDYYIQRITRER